MELTQVLLKDIESDSQYRISRYTSLHDLIDSIKKNGIIEPPILIKNDSMYKIISGHRRIEAVFLQGYSDVKSIVWNDFDYQEYVREAGRKMYHKSAGIIGRINAFCILASSEDYRLNEQKFRQILHIPNDTNLDALEKIKKLPDVLLRYLDEKDASLKLVMQISNFDDMFILILQTWAEKQFRFSIFRIAIDMYMDIHRDEHMMDGFTKKIDVLREMQNDDEIIGLIKEIRYPSIDYYAKKAEELKTLYARNGAELKIPIYEEGKQPSVSIGLKWSDKGSSYKKTLEFLQKEKIEDILSIL